MGMTVRLSQYYRFLAQRAPVYIRVRKPEHGMALPPGRELVFIYKEQIRDVRNAILLVTREHTWIRA